MPTVDPATRAALAPYGFDEQALEAFVARLSRPVSNAVQGALTPPAP